MTTSLDAAYRMAADRYAERGVDTEAALARLATIPISLHCWQGDDVGGFETVADGLSGGIAATGNYPGKARTPDELRADATKALSLIPGRHRFNLHATYGDFGGQRVDRDAIGPEHFAAWIDWAKTSGHRPRLQSDVLLTSARRGQFHAVASATAASARSGSSTGSACRRIAAAMGRALGTPAVTNLWIPDGMKDTPIDRRGPRERLIAVARRGVSRNRSIRRTTSTPSKASCSASASRATPSARTSSTSATRIARRLLLTLDTGHYHPTETIADKISAVLMFVPEILLHVSRGVRWDSDHVVVLSDDVPAIGQELVRGDYLSRTHIGLDFFDASINRVAAWVVGTRNVHEGAAQGACSSPPRGCAPPNRRATTRRASRCSKRTRPCRLAPCGTASASDPACPSERRGSTRSSATRPTCCRRVPDAR